MKLAIIDDDSAVLMLLELCLQSAGHQVHSICVREHQTAEGILEQLQNRQIDAVLLDFRLPDIAVFELKKAVCQKMHLEPSKVIFLTASPENIPEPHPCIAKPFSPLTIAAQICAMLEHDHNKDNG